MEFQHNSLDDHEQAAFAFAAVDVGILKIDASFLGFFGYFLSKKLSQNSLPGAHSARD
jgi:hypothetical protein